MSKKIDIKNEDFYYLLQLIRGTDEDSIILHFKKDSNVYKNAINLKTLQRTAEEKNIDLRFSVENPAHKDFIKSVNGDEVEMANDELSLDEEDEVSTSKFNLFAFLAGIRNKNTGDSESTGKSKKIKFILIPLGVIIGLIGLFFVLWWYIPTAEVKFKVDTQGLIKLFDVKASTDYESVSVEEMAIPASSVSVSETDSQTIPTTGTKEVGEYAEGEITITNKTDDDIDLDSGTVVKLISSKEESLRYEIREDITVPKKEVGPAPDNETTYGTKSVEIRALNYGDDYNQGKEKQFEIDDYDTDELIAENEDDIDGGTLEEVNVVAQADLDSLRKDLEAFMEGKVEESLNRKIVTGQTLPTSSITFSVGAANFDKQLDEEAEELTLTMVMEATGLAYGEDSLDELMEQVVPSVVPDSFDLSDEKIEFEVAATKGTNDSTLNLQVKLKSYIAPRIDENKIRNDLTGMSIEEAQNYLDNISDVSSFEIIMSPQLPAFLMRLPRRAENITVEIEVG